ncbi:MAG TPA: RHS repeat-associated core domain-containing protein, partial [Gemmatimonadaceae bacterium]
PLRSYAQQHCEGFDVGAYTNPALNATDCVVVFPAYPNDASNGYTIAPDSAQFTYDQLGNILTANNGDARISRQYYVGGALKSETASYRAAAGTTFPNSYQLNYAYDLDGRRKTLQLPSGDVLAYGYHTDLGVLNSVADPRGNRYRYDYDLAGRIDSAVVGTPTADGLTESRNYDSEGRLIGHVRVSAVFGHIYDDALTLDALGRTTRASSSTRANGGAVDSAYFYYSAFGAVLAREHNDGVPTHWDAEEFRVDALGNVLSSRAGDSNFGPADPRYASYSYTSTNPAGRRGLMTDRATSGAPLHEIAHTLQKADFDGNIYQSQDQVRQAGSLAYTADTPTHQYYSAAGQLRAVQRYRFVSSGSANGVFEEYRYDALDRRVLVLARHGTPPASLCPGATLCATLCNSGCVESVTRTIWDGSAIAHEERRGYPDETVTSPAFNSVEYVHGLEIDHPFAALDAHVSGFTRALNWTWRGSGESSVGADGSSADCTFPTTNCDAIAWPNAQAVYSRTTPMPAPTSGGQSYLWAGSLVLDQQDKTGQHFRRNRYYDSQSGRFTQEDPIGLAGGMNLYGFAGGDPVNFSDPFGLWPDCTTLPCPLIAGGAAALGGPVTIFGAAVVGVFVLDNAFGSHGGSAAFSERAGADATAYRPGGRFSGKTKGQIDRDATAATGQTGTCEYCGITLVPVPGSPNSTEYDHQKAKSKGGDNSPENGRRSCRTCNREKGADDKPDPRPPTPPEEQSQ